MEQIKEDNKQVVWGKQDAFLLGGVTILGYALMRLITTTKGYFLVTLFTVALCLSVYFYAKSKKKILKKSHKIYMVYTLLLSLSFSIFENSVFYGTIHIVLALSFAYWVLVIMDARKSDELDEHIIGDFLSGIRRAMQVSELKIQVDGKLDPKSGKLKQIFIALIIGIPLLLIVFVLLLASDDGFRMVVEDLINAIQLDLATRIFTFIISIPVSIVLFTYIRNNYQHTGKQYDLSKKKKVSSLVFTIILGMLILVYLLFFIGAFIGYMRFNAGSHSAYELSQFARNGFFPLLVVVLINLTVFISVKWLSANTTREKLMLTVLGSETLVLVVLAFAKLYLYINSYGYTLLRFNVAWFLVVLFLCISIFMIGVWIKVNYVRISIATFACIFLSLQFVNVGKYMINYNIGLYQDGTRSYLDMSVVYAVGADGVDSIVELYEKEENTYTRSELVYFLSDLSQSTAHDNWSLNMQRIHASSTIDSVLDEISFY